MLITGKLAAGLWDLDVLKFDIILKLTLNFLLKFLNVRISKRAGIAYKHQEYYGQHVCLYCN